MTVLTREIAEALIAEQGLDVVIPDGYTSIDRDAFQDFLLTSIAVPESITTILSGTFSNNQLKNAEIPESTEVELDAFDSDVAIIRRSVDEIIHRFIFREWKQHLGSLYDNYGSATTEEGTSISTAGRHGCWHP